MNRQAPRALDRILALGEKASRYSEAALARKVGVSRERIRQLKAHLPHKPVNRRAGEPGYGGEVERAFYTAMRRGIDRLVALVDVRGDDECWPWLGHRTGGYGVLRPSHRYVHRLIYERGHGPIPKGMLVVAGAAVALLLAACGPAVRAPEVRLRSINARSAEETVVGLEIFNPNRFPLHVLSVDYEVCVGKRLCGKGRRSEELFLDARDTTLADFPLAIDYPDLLKSIPALFTDTVVFNVKGRYVVSTFVGRRQFGFSGERKIAAKDVVQSFVKGLFDD